MHIPTTMHHTVRKGPNLYFLTDVQVKLSNYGFCTLYSDYIKV